MRRTLLAALLLVGALAVTAGCSTSGARNDFIDIDIDTPEIDTPPWLHTITTTPSNVSAISKRNPNKDPERWVVTLTWNNTGVPRYGYWAEVSVAGEYGKHINCKSPCVVNIDQAAIPANGEIHYGVYPMNTTESTPDNDDGVTGYLSGVFDLPKDGKIAFDDGVATVRWNGGATFPYEAVVEVDRKGPNLIVHRTCTSPCALDVPGTKKGETLELTVQPAGTKDGPIYTEASVKRN